MEIEVNQDKVLAASTVDNNLHRAEEYSEIARALGLNFWTDESFIHVGTLKCEQGWIVHLTVIPKELPGLMETIVPLLTEFQLPFKIIKNKELHREVNNGSYGKYKIGKVMTIFLDNEHIATDAIKRMMQLTTRFVGPEIYGDFRLSNNIYFRYGSFVHRTAIDGMGNKVVVIKDNEGNVFVDRYSEPPFVPHWAYNPFLPLIEGLRRPKAEYLIGERFIPLKPIKRDVKGNVWKGIYFSKYFIPRWCVIKEGRLGMWPDDYGRDISSRLKWQYKVNQYLDGHIPNAKVIAHFGAGDHWYLVMQYIKGGRDAIKAIFKMMDNKPWFDQPSTVKKEVLGLLLQIVEVIREVHRLGIVYRDISGTNFLIDRKGKVFLIDFELSYSVEWGQPDPAFGLGTYGFMSPEQERHLKPTISEDIYSLGALMSMIFTDGLLPYYFIEKDWALTFRKLMFFVRDKEIADMIRQCMEEEPGARPALTDITDGLRTWRDRAGVEDLETNEKSTDEKLLKETIQGAIAAFAGQHMSTDGLWYSNIENHYGPEVYPLKKKHFFGGLYRGIGGVLWCLAKLKRAGIDIRPVQGNIQSGIAFLKKEVLPGIEYMTPSYYYGSAGLAVLLVELISEGWFSGEGEYLKNLEDCFKNPVSDLSIINGAAGQGIALMKCGAYLNKEFLHARMQEYAGVILNSQERDGSWGTGPANEVVYGFGYGIAGIAYFLLEFGTRYGRKDAILAAEKAIHYLLRSARRVGLKIEWLYSSRREVAATWWCNGGPGIALTVMKAYEATHDDNYLQWMTKILLSLPPRLIYQDLSLCHGLSGLGEVYLKAFKQTGHLIWRERADWIASAIIYQVRTTETGALYWQVEPKNSPTADLMVGNAGVIHFLARCSHSEMEFPLL